jgi:endonuclease I
MKKLMLIALFLVLCLKTVNVVSQIPTGYYDSAQGLTGLTLKTALYNIIKGHTSVSYANLYACYVTTDNLPTNKVWDMYSIKADGTANYWFTNSANSSDQCGSYSAEGDCYNREHTTPSSWFNDATPMYTDLFNVYPTDGYVNNRRSNYPHADVSSASWTSSNGSQLGSCGDAGYTGTVFEPIDSFKGDFARNYLYMATRYENVVAGWPANSTECAAVYAGNGGLVFKPWYVTVLLAWCTLDTVSQKEVDRNNAVYAIQHNRNPYIDHPEWVYSIWGPTAGTENIEALKDFINVYPVPATENVSISCGIPSVHFTTVSLYSFEGKLIYENNCSKGTGDITNIDVSDFSSGLYFIKLNSDMGVVTKQLVIQ